MTIDEIAADMASKASEIEPVCINKSTAVPETDGSYAIYLSHRTAPRNWISTAGYREGILFARWLLADALPETPVVEVGRW